MVAKTVSSPEGGRLVREPSFMKRPDEERRRAVAGEHATRPVRAVSRRSQPYDDQSRARVAEAGHGPSPVLLMPELALLLPSHEFAILHETRTPGARDDLTTNQLEGIGHVGGKPSS